MFKSCIRVVCLLTASLMATHVLSQDLSGWSDKTVCRLVESDGGAVYVEEATNRGLDCKAPIKAVKAKPESDKSSGIDIYGGGSPPEEANPNYETLRYFLYRYLYYASNMGSRYHTVKASNNPYNFEFDLREDKYIKQQMQETPLLSYLLYEDGKIVVDEITPKDRFSDMFTDSSMYISMSMGKSIASYITGHAICEGYIESVDSRLDDWPIVENTLYYNQKLIDILNMAAGDSAYAKSNEFINSNRGVNDVTVQSMMKNEFKGSKRSSSKYNYADQNPNMVLSYIIFKYGEDGFKQLLDNVLKEKARIRHGLFINTTGTTREHEQSPFHQVFTTRYDYLRIAKAMLDDWKGDTCVGKYLKTIHARRIPKNGVQGTTGRVGMPKSYGGFFHTGYKGMENRPVMSMDGWGGQTITIDFERERIVATLSIHDNMKFPKAGSFDWKKIVYETIKNGKPASISKVKQPAEEIIDPQQLIFDNEAKQEAERKAKQYWDDYYGMIFWGASADGSAMLSEDFENVGQRDILVSDRKNKWYIKQDNDDNSIYCNKVTADWTEFKFGSELWSDYSVSYRMRFSAGKGGRAETLIRKTFGSEYRTSIGSYGGVEIYVTKNGRPRASGFVSTKTGEWLDIQLTASGNEIKYLVDGEVVASAIDDKVKKGSGFFAVSANSEVCIDDIVVNKI